MLLLTSGRRAGRRSFRTTGAQRRKRIWARHPDEAINLATAGAVGRVDLLDDFRTMNGGAAPIGSTVGGTFLDVHVEGLTAVNAIFVGLVVSDTGQTAGDLPDPQVDWAADWLFWSAYYPGTGGVASQITARERIRSMRKMEELGQTVYIVVSGQEANLVVNFTTSVLLILP